MNKSIAKYFTLFSSIIAVILGIIILSNVFASVAVINVILVILLGLLGIAKICGYASQSKPSVWDLVLGILYLIVCILLIANVDVFDRGQILGYIFAVIAIISGIGHFIMAYQIRKHIKDAPISGEVVSGIIATLLGICFIVLPIFTQLAYVWIIGIFLIVAGIVGGISALTISTRKK